MWYNGGFFFVGLVLVIIFLIAGYLTSVGVPAWLAFLSSILLMAGGILFFAWQALTEPERKAKEEERRRGPLLDAERAEHLALRRTPSTAYCFNCKATRPMVRKRTRSTEDRRAIVGQCSVCGDLMERRL